MEKVKIYTTPACGYCKMAKSYFTEHGVEFEEYDVATDVQKRQEMFDKSHQMGVPLIEIGNELVLGFDKNRIDSLLGLS
ncbi:MAG: NrdH-redoxin [Candidatus Yanofskybacteria bacterium CG10_big_fil_rev_8_21_14_0_10_46_23]|uniref:NrdH-redoxin n=1 Tax=Candidatus Yanofskybacteria bacterium CG10_big_fil_rev_8_21_14_0_10_46_23 TaxID=1975098 RepID=A0A2H0R4S5_9BACT|nr:MAG: NrdH-redoxin [Candidatus Yanofskybacteria bacterium CG10_big_fil_rev_8_21_14_0_10_46_23]